MDKSVCACKEKRHLSSKSYRFAYCQLSRILQEYVIETLISLHVCIRQIKCRVWSISSLSFFFFVFIFFFKETFNPIFFYSYIYIYILRWQKRALFSIKPYYTKSGDSIRIPDRRKYGSIRVYIDPNGAYYGSPIISISKRNESTRTLLTWEAFQG